MGKTIKKVLIAALSVWGIVILILIFKGQPEFAAKVFVAPFVFLWGAADSVITFVKSLFP